MSAILSTAASLCIKPTKTPLALYIYWPKHLMVASIQRILLQAAAFYKSSTVLFLRFQPSPVFSNFNFEFVSSLFDSSDEDHSCYCCFPTRRSKYQTNNQLPTFYVKQELFRRFPLMTSCFSLTTMTSETKGAFFRYIDLFIFLEVQKVFQC